MKRDYESLRHKKKRMKASEARKLTKSSVAVLAVLMPLSALAPSTAYAATRTWIDITHGGSFSYAEGIAVDSIGDVFVANSRNNTILEHTTSSSTWEDISNGGSFNSPADIAVDSAGDVFVVNYNNSTILERRSGSTTWHDITNGGAVRYPESVAVDSTGDVFVVNSGNSTVIERTSGSTTWKDITNGAAFNFPTGIAVDSTGNVFVADTGGDKIFERLHGSTSWQDITNGAGFNGPYSIAVDSAGDLFVVSSMNSTIFERASGSTTWQGITNGDGTFNLPRGIAVDNAGNLYVTNALDATTNAVEEYALSPQSLVASNTTSTSVTLSWNALAGASSYNVYENTGSTPIATGVTGTTYTVSGLNPGETLWFTVSAVVGGGESAQSAGISVETTPTSPTGLKHSNVTQTGWTEQWTWVVTGATGYNVYINGTKVNSIPIGVPSYPVTGETAGTTYKVTVTAVDSGGETVQSMPDNVTTLPNPPSAPTGLSSGSTTSTSTTLSWTASSGATSYDVYENGKQLVTGVTGTSYTVSGLTPSTSIPFTVSAVNAGGESAQSSPVSVLTTPAAPTGLTHNSVAQTGWTESWTAVTGATGYNVYINGTKVTKSPIPVPTYTVTGETAGATYSMTVSAVDATGESVQSKADSVTTLPNAPGTPTGLSSGSTTSTSSTLSWNAASGATSYNVYENGKQIATGVTATSYTVNGLTPGTSNPFTVSAVNAGGESAQSSAVSVLTLPSTPTGLAVNGATSTGTTLNWSAATGATSYNVYENGNSTPIATGVTGTNFTVDGLTPGWTYSFTVSAVSAGRESEHSNATTVATAHIGSIDITAMSTNVIGGSTVTVTGVVYDTYHVPVPYAIVNISSIGGTFSDPQVTANASGQFTSIWTAPGVNQDTNETVTASVYGTVYQSVYEPSTSAITPTTLSFSVAPMPKVGTASLPPATVNTDYSQTLQVGGGFGPYTWSVTTGTLPSGLSLDAKTGIISGTPTAEGTSSFTVQVTDTDGNRATQNLSMTVNAAPTYLVTYNGNGNTSGSVPKDSNKYRDGSSVTVLGNTGNLAKTGYTFAGWNTVADGSGKSYSAGSSVTIGTSDATMYAQWIVNSSGGSRRTSGKPSSGSTSSTSTTPGTTPSPTPNTNTTPPLPMVVASHTFSSEGGTVQQTLGHVTVAINVPQGTFAEPTTLTVTTGSAKNVTHLVNGLPDASVGVVLGVNFSGGTPSKPITVTITNPSVLADAVLYKLTADGRLIPMKATVSAGKAVVSFTSDPDFVALNVAKDQRVITTAGQARIVTGLVRTDGVHGNKTTYFPIWYVMQMLKTLNVNSTWDGHNWHITTANTPTLGTVSPGTGSMHMYVNGTLVQNVNGFHAKDSQTGVETTYMPIWYVMQMLKTLNISSSWNGTTWTLSNNATQSGNTNSTN